MLYGMEIDRMAKANWLSLDLEMNQPSQKIIQIGAVAGNIFTGQILERLSVFVNPGEQVREDIVKLTGITQEMVDAGVRLEDAYSQLAAMHARHDCYVTPITWGGGDSQELREQLNEKWTDARTLQHAAVLMAHMNDIAEILELESRQRFQFATQVTKEDLQSFCFGRRWFDVKTLYIGYCLMNDMKLQAGLAKAMTKFGLAFKGRKHNALDDAENTFTMARTLLRYLKEKPLSKGAEDYAKSQS
jgi:inhibitor of KinA sporulation pathway (predicted exonuclease)